LTDLNSRIARYATRSVNRFLTHKFDYTRKASRLIADADGNPILDEWDQRQYTDSTLVEEKRCLFLWKDAIVNTANGPINKKTPIIYMPTNMNLVEGDILSNIRTKQGTLLITTARVETVDNVAGFGEAITKVCVLTAVVV
jgi:hypothetical protein